MLCTHASAALAPNTFSVNLSQLTTKERFKLAAENNLQIAYMSIEAVFF